LKLESFGSDLLYNIMEKSDQTSLNLCF